MVLFYKILYLSFSLLAVIVLIFTCNTVKTPHDIFHHHHHNEHIPGNGETVWLAQSEGLSIVAARWVKEGLVFYRNFVILQETDTVYTDIVTAYYTNYGLLPIVRPLNNGQTEVLIGFVVDNDFQIDMLQLIFADKKLVKQDTLPMFDGNHIDYDNDGQVEFSGFLGYFPTYCFGCDSDYYRPKWFYEMSLQGMAFDSTATQLWIQNTYGTFSGFMPDSTVILPVLTPDFNL